jgi:antitoxin CcdA
MAEGCLRDIEVQWRLLGTLPTLSHQVRVGLVAEACALEVNASQAGEVGIAAAAARRRQECWLAESQDALVSSNVFVEQHGLPLAQYRHF